MISSVSSNAVRNMGGTRFTKGWLGTKMLTGILMSRRNGERTPSLAAGWSSKRYRRKKGLLMEERIRKLNEVWMRW
jgi:hypothetical protein